MPGMNGIEATRTLIKELPSTKVIALSMHIEKDTVTAMREAGAAAYFTKGNRPRIWSPPSANVRPRTNVSPKRDRIENAEGTAKPSQPSDSGAFRTENIPQGRGA